MATPSDPRFSQFPASEELLNLPEHDEDVPSNHDYSLASMLCNLKPMRSDVLLIRQYLRHLGRTLHSVNDAETLLTSLPTLKNHCFFADQFLAHLEGLLVTVYCSVRDEMTMMELPEEEPWD